MWFGYHPEIVEKYPEIAAAVLWVDSFENVKHVPEIDGLLSESERLIRESCPERAAIAQQPSIAGWRDVYSRMVLKPNRYPCATEQLMRRVVDGQPIPRIAAIVDLGNAAALRFMIPIAPFDLKRIEDYCEVRHATGDERFWPINSDTPDEIPEGEVIFADGSPDVISRRWAWRQSDKGKITPETGQVVIVAEAVHADAAETVRECGEFLHEYLTSLLNAEVRLDILDANTPLSDYATGAHTP
jgi:DNA/RNA-binding domain of Phe-tRNA-synthetase-like protein